MSWRARDVWFRYPASDTDAVAGADLDAGPGEMVAILGPNGAGKSTLLRLLLGVAAPDHGEAEYAGRPAVEWSPLDRARRIGVLPQSLYEALRALEADELFAQQLGKRFMNEFIQLKQMEWIEYQRHVSDWEVRQYLEFF